MSTITRRQLLQRGGAAAGSAALLAAGRAAPGAGPHVAWAAGCDEPMPRPSRQWLLLSRATYGPTAEERARLARMGIDAWVEEQIHPAAIDDGDVDDALAPLETLGWTLAQSRANNPQTGRQVGNEMVAATLYRAVRSRRQLFEVMVDHWSNQFNVFLPEEFIARVKPWDDHAVYRAHALGRFRDLAHGSARSPAMVRYLDAARNTRSGPNENFARELMELHLLGVDGGYTEQDVKEVARCFTGWNYHRDTWEFEFRPADHAPGPKTVLGRTIPEAGADEGRMVIDLLVDQPACARHVARRLVQRFVADTPPEGLVAEVAGAFGRDGDIPAMLRRLLTSEAFYAAHAAPEGGPAKIRRPLEFWAAALRAVDADVAPLLEDIPRDTYEGEAVVNYAGRAEEWLAHMEHLPFRWRSPNGYPDAGTWWGGAHVMIARWNYALALCEGRLRHIDPYPMAWTRKAGVPFTGAALVDAWADRVLGRPILPRDRDGLIAAVVRGDAEPLPEAVVADRLPLLVALLLDSPYFLWR